MCYVDKKSVVRPYLQDLLADNGLMSCQIRGTFMRSCQPHAPAERPLPPRLTCSFMEPPLQQARRALGVVWGYHMTYFGAACQAACSAGICKHCRTHPLR